jgi:hypothetical protein
MRVRGTYQLQLLLLADVEILGGLLALGKRITVKNVSK